MEMTAKQALETAVVFGEQCQLTGVYTASSAGSAEQPCALFLTAGLLHHIGPTRLYVELARSLSAQGVPGLRFDLSGAGDSEPSSLGGDFQERSVREVGEAMDHLQATYGHKRFVLLGLCSGADDALATSLQDPRVVGIVLLNGYAYPAGRFKWHLLLRFYLPRIFMWQKLRNRTVALANRVLKRRPVSQKTSQKSAQKSAQVSAPVSAQKSTQAAVSDDEQAALIQLDNDYRYIPPQEQTAQMLARLCEAETDVMFMYTGSEYDTYTYEGQLAAMYPALSRNPHLSERYLPEADHTLVLKEDREKVVQWVGEWFRLSAFKRQRL